ncbi:MAG: carbon-nitrogen hydrolase [Gemmatimonadetes bacterium]|nr:carbon-nitrogen hydrolase [Gemmatimonadota bacterium]
MSPPPRPERPSAERSTAERPTVERPRVRLVQMTPRLGDVPRNLDAMLEAVTQARADGVDLVVFPELALTGYALRDLAADCAIPRDAPEMDALREASTDVSIAFGFVEHTADHRFFNAGAYLEGGEILHVHRKTYLPTYGLFEEARHFAAGDRVRAFDTRFGRMAMLVCEDAWHLPLPYLAAMDGANTLLILASSPTRGVGKDGKAQNTEGWEQLLETYASSLTMFVAFANRAGFEDGVGFWGGSELVTPGGVVVAKGAYHENDAPTTEMDLDLVRQERIANPLLRDERIPLVISELTRILHDRRGTEPSARAGDPAAAPAAEPSSPPGPRK